MMESEKHRKIRERAHQLWEEGGRQDGQSERHWAQATAEVEDAGKRQSDVKPGKADKAGKEAAPPAKPKAKAAAADAKGTAASKGKTKAEPAPKAPAKGTAPAAAPKSKKKS
jgi:hypothetical protein